MTLRSLQTALQGALDMSSTWRKNADETEVQEGAGADHLASAGQCVEEHRARDSCGRKRVRSSFIFSDGDFHACWQFLIQT